MNIVISLKQIISVRHAKIAAPTIVELVEYGDC